MKLQTRLLLGGALLPTVLLVLALTGIGVALDQLLLRAIDRALVAQATVESVSLFDRISGAHLHAELSPLQGLPEAPAWTALYGPDGKLRLQEPDHAPMPRTLLPTALSTTPQLHTQWEVGTSGQRVLLVAVPGPDRQLWTLRVAQPLERHRQTMVAYGQAAAAIGLLVAALLLALQVRHGRQLNGRVEHLAEHLRRLRAGQLDTEPHDDTEGDVLTELHDLVQDATRKLGQARDQQERLLADAAHELRTPLTVLRTDLDVTLRRERHPDELLQALVRSREEVERLGNLAKRLLELAALRQAGPSLALTDVCALVQQAMLAWQARFAEHSVLLRVVVPDTLHAQLDRDRVRQVLDNLLANALDHAPQGTAVEVTVTQFTPGWQLTVADQGPGVPEPEREAVFAAFHRLDRRKDGSGLGLAIVRDVAEQHRGRAWVEAAGETGARFCVGFGA